MILIDNKEGLIGDFLGTIPAMQRLSEIYPCVVNVHHEIIGLFDLIKNSRLLNRAEQVGEDWDNLNHMEKITFTSGEAFQIAAKKGYYMTQAFMEQAGLEVPKIAPKAKLNYDEPKEKLDYYIISPFARSLPPEQKWPVKKWIELINSLPNSKFILVGNSKYDDYKDFIYCKNLIIKLDSPFHIVCKLFKGSKGLISVVTGTSHLAFHLGVKNIVLTNQGMTWGNQPDAIKIITYIPDITVEEVIEKIKLLN